MVTSSDALRSMYAFINWLDCVSGCRVLIFGLSHKSGFGFFEGIIVTLIAFLSESIFGVIRDMIAVRNGTRMRFNCVNAVFLFHIAIIPRFVISFRESRSSART